MTSWGHDPNYRDDPDALMALMFLMTLMTLMIFDSMLTWLSYN